MARIMGRDSFSTLSRFLRVNDLPSQLVFTEKGKKVRCVTHTALETATRLKGVVTMGVYAAKKMGEDYYLSIEGSQLLGPYLEGGVVEVSMNEAENWMRGAPIERSGLESGIAVVKMGWLFLGSGRVSRDGRIYPLIPKERMISHRNGKG
jgi:NOL1/NOP2/fmu family ribosome biogenesis protein